MGNEGANEPCWCGSGIKYKKCHRDRDSAPPVTFQDALTFHKKARDYPTCLHPNADAATCKGPIVKAHTVQRSGGLTQIARNGAVYRFPPEYANRTPEAKFSAQLGGIGKAMTFRGFCNFHDTELFRPIERHPIEPSAEQAVLLGYRAVCFEVYQKICHSRVVPFFRETDRGKDLEAQHHIQKLATLHEASVALGLRELRARKARYEEAIARRDFSAVRYPAFHLDQVPDVLCSGSCAPEFDFEGNRIQLIRDLDPTTTLQDISFCSIPRDQGGLAMLVWLGDQPASLQMARTLDAIPDNEIPDALVRLMFEFFENLAAAPDWWERLPESARNALLKRLSEGNLREQRSHGLLNDGLSTAQWRVTKRTSFGLDLVHTPTQPVSVGQT